MEKQVLISYFCDLESFKDVLDSIENTEYNHVLCGQQSLQSVLFMESFNFCAYVGEIGYYYHLVFASYLDVNYKVVIRVKCEKISPSPLDVLQGFTILSYDLNKKGFRFIAPCLCLSSDSEINNLTNSTPSIND